MNNLNKEISANPGLTDQKEAVREYLQKLLEISGDPEYDRYIRQMMRDLESGKASPFLVRREADRTYQLYLEKISEKRAPADPGKVEFKIGAGIFSVIGAVFVLIAFMIFALNYLSGIWQGVCLYGACVLTILVSELFIKRFGARFSLAITGIGISGLFVSTVINYLVLKTINETAACLIILATAFFSTGISRKRDSSACRLICILGSYIGFWPIQSFESEAGFLFMAGMFFLVNLAGVYLSNRKNQTVVDAVHMVLHPLVSVWIAKAAVQNGISAVYPACLVITSVVIVNLIFFRHRGRLQTWFTVTFLMSLSVCALLLFALTGFRHGNANEMQMLYYRLITEIMAAAAAVIFFVLWEKEKYRWIQYYFIAAVVVLFNGFGYYRPEQAAGVLFIFLLTRFLSGRKELTVLDGILSVTAALKGIALSSFFCDTNRYIWLFFAAFLLSVFFIRQMGVFHEIVITVFAVACILLEFTGNWTLPGCAGLLLLFFIFFNHLPWLKKYDQLPYNIFNVVFSGLFYLCAWFCYDFVISSVTMLIGTAAILIMFRKRYGMTVPRKCLIVAGFLIYMILTAHYESPVTVSVLLMAVAIGSVGIGFRLKDKVYRIFGSTMAVCVCVKLIACDFRGLDLLPGIILFLLVGVMALGISFFYIRLEKRQEEKELQENNTGKDMEKNEEGMREE